MIGGSEIRGSYAKGIITKRYGYDSVTGNYSNTLFISLKNDIPHIYPKNNTSLIAASRTFASNLFLNLNNDINLAEVEWGNFSKSYNERSNIPQKLLSDIFQTVLNQFEKETEITKENKKIKEKTILLSYEEMDYLKLQLKETVKRVEEAKQPLKWYQFLQKLRFNFVKKQSEMALEELGKSTVVKEGKKKK